MTTIAMITGPTATMLRSSVARSCGLQPILLRAAACQYSTTTLGPFAVRAKSTIAKSIRPFSPRTSPIVQATKPFAASISFPQPAAARRQASTTSSTTTTPSSHDQDATAAAQAAAASQQKAAANPNPDMPPLDWNTFFKLRKTRRWWQVSFSIIMSIGGGAAGGMFLAGGGADWVTGQIPLDPIVTLGLMTFAFMAMGWLVGPSIGSQIFYMFNKKFRAPMHLVS